MLYEVITDSAPSPISLLTIMVSKIPTKVFRPISIIAGMEIDSIDKINSLFSLIYFIIVFPPFFSDTILPQKPKKSK